MSSKQVGVGFSTHLLLKEEFAEKREEEEVRRALVRWSVKGHNTSQEEKQR